MVLKAQVRTCELRGHKKKKKKKDFPNPINIEVTGPDLWHQFRKYQNFCFYGPKGTVRTCELCGHEKEEEKKNRFTQPP